LTPPSHGVRGVLSSSCRGLCRGLSSSLDRNSTGSTRLDRQGGEGLDNGLDSGSTEPRQLDSSTARAQVWSRLSRGSVGLLSPGLIGSSRFGAGHPGLTGSSRVPLGHPEQGGSSHATPAPYKWSLQSSHYRRHFSLDAARPPTRRPGSATHPTRRGSTYPEKAGCGARPIFRGC
jgi:hypothetical protein